MESLSRPSRLSEYRLSRRVHFYETDAAGIAQFSCFFRYMEEAEHAMWRAAGLSIAPARSDIGFPRVAAAFEFHKPLRFEDEFEVWIRVAAITEKSMHYTSILTRGETRIATGSLTTVCVRRQPDGSIKAIAIPSEIADRFEVAASSA